MEDSETQEESQPRKEELTPDQAFQVAIDSLNEVLGQRVASLAGFAELSGSDDPRFTKKDLYRNKVKQEISAVGKALHTIVRGLEHAKEGKPTWVKTLGNGATVFTQNPDPLVK